ncbi:hypothetical protein L1987_46154 [Smallanthus sonchifolius]|uniref:Uncharacterized protein n=1 Tax=Smallanthus sonchifolius TaxID=185202 RepID=A0ACB9FZY4_9ASTR|nr:hypothetical protein L1987_46154 [Smallanthus sonchifolius]
MLVLVGSGSGSGSVMNECSKVFVEANSSWKTVSNSERGVDSSSDLKAVSSSEGVFVIGAIAHNATCSLCFLLHKAARGLRGRVATNYLEQFIMKSKNFMYDTLQTLHSVGYS